MSLPRNSSAASSLSGCSHQHAEDAPIGGSHHYHPRPFQEHAQFETFETTATSDGLARHLTLFDLVSLGVGGTVGSGIFVLTGQIAREYAGPATFISWSLAGLAAFTSGLAFAELAARIPHSGSTYAYARIAGGKQAAVVAAACLTLEYMISGSAVARTWGDKVLVWLQRSASDSFVLSILGPVEWINIPASLISIACTLLLLAGVRESKFVTNLITAIKMIVVSFMIVGGLFLFQPVNMQPPLAPYGIDGVLRGATSSFFGYLGYDEICVVAGEAKHPKRDLPRAVMGTLVIVTVCYILGAIALTGMLPFTEISAESGFPNAFADRGWAWASQFTAFGEVATLPVVVLISLLAQPRLTFAMAKDGILPSAIFAPLDENGDGSLYNGTLIAGVIMTVVAAFVPFTYLDDLISCGILVAFSMTNSALILFRCTPETSSGHGENSSQLPRFLIIYHALCFVSAMAWNVEEGSPVWTFVAIVSSFCLLICLCWMLWNFPSHTGFVGLGPEDRHDDSHDDHNKFDYFETPLVPFIPCMGIAVNWYLIAQLEYLGLFLLALYLGTALILHHIFRADGHVYHNVACDREDRGTLDGLGSPIGIGLPTLEGRSS